MTDPGRGDDTLRMDASTAAEMMQLARDLGLHGSVPRVRFVTLVMLLKRRAGIGSLETRQACVEMHNHLVSLLSFGGKAYSFLQPLRQPEGEGDQDTEGNP